MDLVKKTFIANGYILPEDVAEKYFEGKGTIHGSEDTQFWAGDDEYIIVTRIDSGMCMFRVEVCDWSF